MMPRKIRDAKIQNSRRLRQERLDHEDCLGEYPDNDCDRETCLNMCTDVEECLAITRKGEEP